MSTTKKITQEQLDRVIKDQGALNNLLVNIGILEAQKHSYLHQLATVNKDIEDFKIELTSQYGDININLEDGSYTNIENTTE